MVLLMETVIVEGEGVKHVKYEDFIRTSVENLEDLASNYEESFEDG